MEGGAGCSPGFCPQKGRPEMPQDTGLPELHQRGGAELEQVHLQHTRVMLCQVWGWRFPPSMRPLSLRSWWCQSPLILGMRIHCFWFVNVAGGWREVMGSSLGSVTQPFLPGAPLFSTRGIPFHSVSRNSGLCSLDHVTGLGPRILLCLALHSPHTRQAPGISDQLRGRGRAYCPSESLCASRLWAMPTVLPSGNAS